MVKLKHCTFKRVTMQLQINHVPFMWTNREKGQHVHNSQVKDEYHQCNAVMMEAYEKAPSKKELNIRSLESECHKQEPRAGAAVQNCAIRDPLQKVCSSIWGGKRSEHFSFSFDEVTDTWQQEKNISLPVFCSHGTFTVTHSHWVNELQRLNCILEQGTSESYNKTGLDGKTGVNLTTVHRFVLWLYMAFLSLTLVPHPLPHTIPIPF